MAFFRKMYRMYLDYKLCINMLITLLLYLTNMGLILMILYFSIITYEVVV